MPIERFSSPPEVKARSSSARRVSPANARALDQAMEHPRCRVVRICSHLVALLVGSDPVVDDVDTGICVLEMQCDVFRRNATIECEASPRSLYDLCCYGCSMAPPDDRATLVRRRQQIRCAKENERSNHIATTQANASSTCDASERASVSTTKKASETHTSLIDTAVSKQTPSIKKKTQPGKTRGKASSSKSSTRVAALNATDAPNVALLIRQVLQRPHYGDLSEYLQTATKEQLFEQTLLIARAVVEVRIARRWIIGMSHCLLLQRVLLTWTVCERRQRRPSTKRPSV